MALYGIYGRHTTAACPWNNIDTARRLQALAESDLESTARQYNIHVTFRHALPRWEVAQRHTEQVLDASTTEALRRLPTANWS